MTWNMCSRTLTYAIREVVISFSAHVAVESGVVVFARTLTTAHLADAASGAVDVAVTRPAVRITVESGAATIAQRRLELRPALAHTRSLRAVSGRVENIATASCFTVKYEINSNEINSTIRRNYSR